MINNVQHPKHSEHRRWLRLAYAFATIVTIFAQMSGAAPILLTDAATSTDQNGAVLADQNGYSAGDTAVVTVTAPSDDFVTLVFDSTKLSYDQKATVAHLTGVDGSVSINSKGSLYIMPVQKGSKLNLYFKVNSALTSGAMMTLHTGRNTQGTLVGGATLKAPGAMAAQQVASTYKAPDATPEKVDSTTTADTDDGATIKLETSGLTPTKDSSGNISSYGVKLKVNGSNALSGEMVNQPIDKLGTMPKIAKGTQFKISWKAGGVTPIQTDFENEMNAEGFYFDWSNISNEEVTVTAGKDIPAGWTMTMAFAITGDTSGVSFGGTDEGGHQIKDVDAPTSDDQPKDPADEPKEDPVDDPQEESADTSTTDVDASELTLSLLAKNPFAIGASVPMLLSADLSDYPNTYRDIQVGIASDALGDNLTFDPEATQQQAESMGLKAKETTKADDYTAYEYTDGKRTYRVWEFADDSLRIEWDKSASGVQPIPLTFKAARATADSGVKLTPEYLGSMKAGDTPAKLATGNGTSVIVSKPDGFEGADYHFDMRSITKDNPSTHDIYHLADIPLFYLTDPDDADLYAFVQNYNAGTQFLSGSSGLRAITQYRKAVLDKKTYPFEGDGDFGGAASTGDERGGQFEDFAKINADGTQDDNTLVGLQANKTYTLQPIHAVAGTTDRFYRPQTEWFAAHYYMPDGLPKFKLSDTGTIQLQGDSDGKAKKGQWTVADNAKTIVANVYKIKYVQVVDEAGDPVDGAKIALTNQDGGTAMHATTSTLKQKDLQGKDATFAGTGELLPEDYQETSAGNGPFYYADGTQALAKLSLPDGYTDLGAAFDLDLDATSDQLKVTNAQHAEVSDDGQTLVVTVHKDTKADTEINFAKVDQDVPSKTLGGASLQVEEVDGAADALKTQTITTADADGKAQLTVDATSTTTKRIFHITETKAPAGYDIGSAAGYYAVWAKGTGFTAVGEAKDAATTTSADKLASVDDGTLTLQDPPTYPQGGQDSGVKLQYVDAAEFLKAGSGTKIAGSQLPVLQENKVYAGSGMAEFSGLGGVVYNPATDPSTLMKADSGLASGTLANDGSMATSAEKSDADGYGNFQSLWHQTGVIHGWEGLAHDTNGWILNNAIVSGTIPSTPEIGYQLLTPAQRQRATASGASGYYNLGGTLTIANDGKTVTAKNDPANKLNAGDRDNSVQVIGKTVQVELYKVKHVSVVDTNGQPVQGAVIKFTNMTATTDTTGVGELLPNDSDHQPVTSGANFVFPDGTQKLVSATDTAGAALNATVSGFGFQMGTGGSDQLAQVGSAQDVAIIDSGQTVQIKVKAPVTVKIHKQDLVNPKTAVPGVTFKVWAANQDVATAVTTAATDANGDTTATLATASTNGNYYIEEASLPDGSGYQKDDKQHLFSWTPASGVTSVGEGETRIAVGDAGALTFSDLKQGGGGVGDNGTNGGQLTIKKVDLNDKTATVPDGATFSVTQKAGEGSVANETATTKNGAATFDLGNATAGERVFLIKETTNPTGYQPNTTAYRLRILPDGQMFLGAGDALANNIIDDHTQDNVITLAGHTLQFGDEKVAANNGGMLSLAKLDATNAAMTPPDGAEFTLEEVLDQADVDAGVTKAVLDEKTVGGKLSFDLGTATSKTRYFNLVERSAPLGYVWNTKVYAVQITADGVVSVGIGPVTNANATTVATTKTTTDKVLTVATGDKGLLFADDEITTQKNGSLTLTKTDFTDRTKGLSGAGFYFMETVNGRIYAYGSGADGEGALVSDAAGAITVNLGAPTNQKRTIVIGEDPKQVPSGYTANTKSYRIIIDAQGNYTVSAETATGYETPAAQTADGVLQVQANAVTFGDKQVANFEMKKTELSDPTQGVSGKATFSIQRIDPQTNQTTGDPITVTTTDGQIATAALTDGKYVITETAAPAGYVKEADPLYFQWQADQGVVAVGGVGMSASTLTAKTAKDGKDQQVLQIDKGVLNFSDAKAATSDTAINLKKVAKTSKQPLAGATFSFQEIVNNVAQKATTVTSDADGKVAYTPSAGSGLRIFRIIETTAPAGYLQASDQYYVQWDKGKILAYGKSAADTKVHPAGYLNADLDATSGVLTVQDAEQTATINTQLVGVDTSDPYDPQGGVAVTLSNPTTEGAGSPLTLTTDASGNAVVSAKQVAAVLGLTPAQMTGSVDVRVTVSNGDGKYTAPLARIVRFTFAGGKLASGFDVYHSGTDALKQDDHMYWDRTNEDVTPGDLGIVLQRDTLSARAMTDTGVDEGVVANAQFTVTFVLKDGTQYTSPAVTTPASGTIILPDPNTLLGKTDVMPINQEVTVVVREIATVSGYTPIKTETTMKYSSGTGYYRLDAPQPVGTIGTASFEMVNGLLASRVTKYFNGGSDITYYLLKQINDLHFSNMPAGDELNLNFGVHELASGDQDIALSDAEDLSPYNGETKPTTTLATDASKIGIGVTQQGQYATGWHVDLEAGPMTSEDTSDTLEGASLSFDNGVGTVSDGSTAQPTALVAGDHLEAALGSKTTMLQADGQTAGDYLATWSLDQVHLHVPGGQGWPDTHYRANMTWNLVVGEP